MITPNIDKKIEVTLQLCLMRITTSACFPASISSNTWITADQASNRLNQVQEGSKHFMVNLFDTIIVFYFKNLYQDQQKYFKRCLLLKKNNYPHTVRQFALTFNLYSRKAYEYVQKKLNKTLPPVRTLSSWYSTLKAFPSIMKESLEVLKLNLLEHQNTRILHLQRELL